MVDELVKIRICSKCGFMGIEKFFIKRAESFRNLGKKCRIAESKVYNESNPDISDRMGEYLRGR